MKSEAAPITDDEWLLRRVRYDRFRTDKVPVISPNAFEPRIKGRDPDTDGISLYRSACLADLTEVLNTIDPERRHEYAIVRVQVSLLWSHGFSVQSKPVEVVRGHVVIPELNASDYENDKARFTPIKLHLATEASKDDNILKRPGYSFPG
jgi:hypothetical protein